MLWVLGELLFLPGTRGPNRYGADPVRPLYQRFLNAATPSRRSAVGMVRL